MKILQSNFSSLIGLFIIIVVFPLGALIYMNKGMNWRKERLEELQTFSELSETQLRSAYDSLAGVYQEEGHIIVASFVNLGKTDLSEQFGENLQKLHEQFDQRKDVSFVTHISGEGSPEQNKLQPFTEKYALLDTAQCFFIAKEEPVLAELAQAYKIERETTDDWREAPYFALVKDKQVLHYYDVRDAKAIRRLVEHIAILIPPAKERENLVFKRETEK